MKTKIIKVGDTGKSYRIECDNDKKYYIDHRLFEKYYAANKLLKMKEEIESIQEIVGRFLVLDNNSLDDSFSYNRLVDFKIIGKVKKQIIDTIEIKELKQNTEGFVKNQKLSENTTNENKIMKEEIKDTISNPLENGIIGCSGATNFEVIYSEFGIVENAEISVIQNFISASNENEDGKFFSIVLLELLKNHNKNVVVRLPKELTEKIISSSLAHVRKVVKKYNQIFSKEIELRELEDFSFIHTDENIIIVEKRGNSIFEAKSVDKQCINLNFIEEYSPLYKKLNSEKGIEILNWIAKNAFSGFKIKTLKKEQIEAIVNIVNKSNTLALLRTGFGKSLIYQLYSFLTPMIQVCIFPIISLINDQERNLSKNKFNFVYTNSQIKENHNIVTSFALKSKRLIFVTPERIENFSFHKSVRGLSKYIGAVVFDEAHCISEWGHDFRPSYLVAKNLLSNISGISNDFRVIALTATAAPRIQRDIKRLLDIQDHNVVYIKGEYGLYRKELNFNINKLQISDSSSRLAIKNSWLDYIEKFKLRATEKKGKSIIYFMFSNKISGSGYPTNNISAKLFFDEMNIKNTGIYSGSTKEYIDTDGKHIKSSELREFQKLDIIFATKSFGMGINMEECNYVAFMQPPASLEDLYQQAGRAGRLGQDSNIDIFYTDKHLGDPTASESPYSFFINFDKVREEIQPELSFHLLNKIFDNDSNNMTINLDSWFERFKKIYQKLNRNNFQNYLKWSIAHLINDYKILDYYSVKYSYKYIKEITIYWDKKNIEKQNLLKLVHGVIKKLQLDWEACDVKQSINSFYSYHFTEIDKQRKIGLNLFIKELKNIDEGLEDDHNKVIMNVINDYYKQSEEEVYKVTEEVYSLLASRASIDEIIDLLDISFGKVGMSKLAEVLARHQINIEFINIISLINYIHFDKEPINDSIKNIVSYKYKNTIMEKHLKILLSNAAEKNKIFYIYNLFEGESSTLIKNMTKLHLIRKV